MDEEAIFTAALELESADQRAAYLDAACAGHAGLRHKVEELLSAHARAGPFLDQAAAAWNARLPTRDEQPIAEAPGTVIGPYKLLEQIGEGGFGAVFMAEQTQPVRRKVALKVLKPGMDTRQVVARFEAERQALAIMDHPHIAKVLDGGATPAGRPYFVMELVKGVPLTDFCDQHQLTPRQRLELFVGVCQAVQHAHQKGIIHRDLKPSNVLVTVHDTTPVVKVIDFGVAKALGQELTDKTLFTGFAQMVGTPLYMSPEQAGQSGLDVDTRSDVYALGVLLYELLTGSTPFDGERLRTAGFDEVRRIIREEEPPRPSTRISTLGQAAATVSDNRRSDPRRLRQLVRGELDWIVMKALEKDRNRRYESASAFAADVQRYLHDEPVLACPPSALYRFRKFARRNKAALVTAMVVASAVLLTVAGLAVSTVLIAREQQATAEALRAETKAKDDLEHDSYFHRVGLAHRELLENNLLQAEELLDQCPADRRAWEWYYLKRLCRVEVEPVTLRGQAGWRHKVAFSPDGRCLASASEDKTVKIWDATTGQELLVLPDTGDVWCAAFRPPDGRWLATGDSRGAVSVWDTATGQMDRTLGRHTDTVRDMAFSPDGRCLASASDDETVKVWDVTTGALLHDLRGHERPVLSVAFSPDGQRLASGSLDTTVNIWDTTTDKLIHTLRKHRNPVYGVAFSPDGRRLASAGLKGVMIWDVTTGQDIRTLDKNGHILMIYDVAFLDDGRRLASVSADKTMKIWDATTGDVVLTLRGHTHDLTGLASSPDGRRLASVSPDRTVKIWDATPVVAGQGALTLHGHTEWIWGLAFSPDGQRLASASADETVRVWDTRTGRQDLAPLKHLRTVFSVAFSPDGRHIASGSPKHAKGESSYLRVWDAATGQEILHPRSNTGYAFSLAFSPDGRWIVTGDEGGAVTVWDATTGRVVGPLGPPGPLRQSGFGLAFSPDGRRLASLNMEGIVKVYDATRWDTEIPQEPLLTFGAHNTPARSSVAFSPDGQQLVVPGDDNTVKIWDVTTIDKPPSAPQLILRGHTAQVWGVAFSPDGRWVASGGEDNTVRIWNAKTGTPVRTFRGHSSFVTRVAFSPDGKHCASASCDRTVKVWDLISLYEKAKK